MVYLTTIRKYLCLPNPYLQYLVDIPQELSTTTKLICDPIEGIQSWLEFNLLNINTLFGELLDQECEFPHPPPVFDAQLRIRDERSFEALLISCNCVLVNTALNIAARLIKRPAMAWLVAKLCSASHR